MKTRMEKYYDSADTNKLLRQHKNESLYANISNIEVDDYKVDNNVTILDNNAQNIDVEQIKKILDTRYKSEPKRRSIVIEDTEEIPEINLDETREYDINAILKQAQKEQVANYEKERVKKLRDTQYDILNSLEIKSEEQKESKENKDDELIDLINTIAMREQDHKNKEELNPLDILTDLKGGDDTVIVNGAKEEESINETSPIMSLEEVEKIKPIIEEEKKSAETKLENPKADNDEKLSSTIEFTQSDFDDFNDLKKEVKSNRALIYAIIILVSLAFLAGLLLFLDRLLDLSIFS